MPPAAGAGGAHCPADRAAAADQDLLCYGTEHYVRVVTDDGECRATANFAQVQEQLQTQPEFLVCNRGVIINMSKVLRFEGDCIEMLDGTHLPVRQKDKNSLLAQFTQYQFRGMQREF